MTDSLLRKMISPDYWPRIPSALRGRARTALLSARAFPTRLSAWSAFRRHIREYRATEFESLCRSVFADVRLHGLFHARKLRVHELALAVGWDTIHARWTVEEARPSTSRPGTGVVRLRVEVVNQADEVVQRGTDLWLVAARPTTPPDGRHARREG